MMLMESCKTWTEYYPTAQTTPEMNIAIVYNMYRKHTPLNIYVRLHLSPFFLLSAIVPLHSQTHLHP